MERFTERTTCGVPNLAYPKSCYYQDGTKDLIAASAYRQLAIDRLAAYEDTGLEPEEIKELCTDDVAEVAKMFRKMIESGEINHLQDLIQAEQDGRLVMLPFQQGKTLVDRTFPENPQLLQNVRVSVAYESSGIIFHYPFNTFIQNVKSGCIFQVSEEADAALAGKGGEG